MGQDFNDQETSLITARTPLKNFPVASLYFTHGERAGQEIPLTRETFFIGRSKNNNLYFDDKSVSRKHAVINVVDGDFIISDLDSLKGIYINGKKVNEVKLRSGDIVNIGENRMQFRQSASSGSKSVGRGMTILVVVLVAIIVAGATWFSVDKFYYQKELPKDIKARIEYHYDRGIEYFNRERNVEKARAEWEKILELDPRKKSDFAQKADKLLKNTAEQPRK